MLINSCMLWYRTMDELKCSLRNKHSNTKLLLKQLVFCDVSLNNTVLKLFTAENRINMYSSRKLQREMIVDKYYPMRFINLSPPVY